MPPMTRLDYGKKVLNGTIGIIGVILVFVNLFLKALIAVGPTSQKSIVTHIVCKNQQNFR